MASACMASAATFPITLTAPEGSSMTVAYDAATNVYTLTTGPTSGKQTVRTNELTAPWPEDVLYLKFDYITAEEFTDLPATAYKCRTGSSTEARTFTGKFTTSDTWQPYNFYFRTWRRSIKFGENVGQYVDFNFTGLPEGTVIKLHDPRWTSDEEAYKLVAIQEGVDNIIEAEDFNKSVSAPTHTSRQLDYPERPVYKNPTDDRFPIYAWCGIDYHVEGFENDIDLGAVRLKKEYKEMEECGFTFTEGTSWPGVDMAALFPGQCVNTNTPIDLLEGTNLKIIARAGLDNEPELAEIYKTSPRLAGYHIGDEPRVGDFNYLRRKMESIRQYDDEHLMYGNLHHIGTNMPEIGATSYENYVTEYVRQVGLGMLSFDYYPVRLRADNGEIYLRQDYFKNLEVVAKMAKYYGMPFWSFAHSVASGCSVPNESYPSPTDAHLRVQVFMSLAYGAQGMQYYTYACPNPYTDMNYHDAPIDWDGNKTYVWYIVRDINADIHAMTDVFLGAELVQAAYTHAETPVGCMRLTPDMLPKGVTSVTSDGQGVAVTLLQNGNKLYMMIVNPDIDHDQNVTIGLSSKLTQIKTDGTPAEVSGEQKHTLKSGGHLVYLVDDNAPAIEKFDVTERPFDRADYRNDANTVVITAHDGASGGHFLPDMGDRTTWNAFSGIMPDASSHVITEDDAIANWGSYYNYYVSVPEDMDVNIFVGHSVPWSEYGRVASTGATPGYGYMVENNPSLNWPKAYAAAMKLELDGKDLTPANQPLRPAVPETFDPAGTEFNRILADKSLWVSTANADNTPSDVLYFWPKEGGKDDVEFRYNELPDYQNVHLTAGEHKIVVKSLSYPWHFDALKIDTKTYSGIESIGVDTDENAPVEWFNLQGIRINPDTAAPGIYLRRQGSKTTKVVL